MASAGAAVRLGGRACVLGGLLLAAGWTLDAGGDTVPGRLLVLASNLLLVYGMMALFAERTRHSSPRLGLWACVLAAAGNMTMVAVTFLTALGAAGVPGAYEALGTPLGVKLAAASGLLLLAGYGLVGTAVLRDERLPSWAGATIVAGIALLFVGAGPLRIRPSAVAGAVLLAGGLVPVGLGVARRAGTG